LIKAFWVLAPIMLIHARDSKRYVFFGGKRELDREARRERAHRLADAFERLGVTYIKIAQFLTTRPDFVPPIYIDELQRLQDDVPPEKFEEINMILEKELGNTDEIFDSFEEKALSCASIAQVHRGRINGKNVAVKVQRPALRKRIEADLTALNAMVSVLHRLMRVTGQNTHAGTLLSITRDVNESLRKEIDFKREASTMTEIRDNVVREGFDEEVVVPEVYGEYSTGRVVTMSFEDGVKIKHIDELESRGHDLPTVAQRTVEAYLRMAFSYGVYQTDPHHGNIAVNEDGQVVIYDYGMSQRPKEEVTDAFARFLAGLGMRDHDITVAALEDLGSVEINSKKQWDAMRDWADALSKDVAGDISEIDLGGVAEAFDESFEDFPIQLNQDILLSLRAITGVQGIATSLDPNYDFSQHLARFFVEEDVFELELDEIREDARERSERIYLDSTREELKQEVRAGNKRTVLSVVASTLVLGSGVLYAVLSSLLVSGVFLGAGLAVFLKVGLSFREKDGVTGPMFMMRYEMEKWENDHRTEEEVARRAEEKTERTETEATPKADSTA